MRSGGERPVAFLSVSENFDLDILKKHLQTFITAGRIAKFWLPDAYITVEGFERTSTGKIDKKPLRRRLE